MCGELVSPSVLLRVSPSQLESPVSESSFQTHTAPLLSWVVVRSTYPVLSSVRAKAGSEGWLPLSRDASHSRLAPVSDSPKATTTGSSETSSTAAMTNSASPSRSRSASSGWVVGL